MPHKKLFIFFGAPFSGKDTLLKKIKRMYETQVMGVGDICRSHISRKTPLAESAQQWMGEHGSTLWPTATLFSALGQWLRENLVAEDNKFLIGDGLLRHPDQVDYIIELCRIHGFSSIVIIEIETPESDLYSREKERPRRPGDHPLPDRLRDHKELEVPALRAMLKQDAIPVQHLVVSGAAMLADRTPFARSIGTLYKMKSRFSRKKAE